MNMLDAKRIECIIEDNGIGIRSSVNKPHSEFKQKSLAMDFIKERLTLLSHTYGASFTLMISDKAESGESESGTRVTIILPLLPPLKYVKPELN